MIDSRSAHEVDDPQKALFLRELAMALHAYGLPAHRLEQALESMCNSLAVEGQFLVTPTSILSSIGNHTSLMRVNQGQTHLEHLSLLNELMSAVGKKELGIIEATEQIQSYKTNGIRYGKATTIAAFSLASSTAAVFFGGGWRESLGAGAIGLVIGVITILGGNSAGFSRLLPAISAFIAALGAHLLATQLDPMFPFLSTLAGLIILIPGLTLTIAMSELAHNHVVSGTARLMGATICFLQLGFGAAMGWKLSSALLGELPLNQPQSLPSWLQWGVLPFIALSFVVLFKARPRDYWQIFLSATTAYAVSRYSTLAMGPEIGIALGAWALGCLSTILARISKGPSAVPLLPGLLLLVPGSLGLKSLQALLGNNISLGVESAFNMSLLAMSLVTGLFLANLSLRPRDF